MHLFHFLFFLFSPPPTLILHFSEWSPLLSLGGAGSLAVRAAMSKPKDLHCQFNNCVMVHTSSWPHCGMGAWLPRSWETRERTRAPSSQKLAPKYLTPQQQQDQGPVFSLSFGQFVKYTKPHCLVTTNFFRHLVSWIYAHS